MSFVNGSNKHLLIKQTLLLFVATVRY